MTQITPRMFLTEADRRLLQSHAQAADTLLDWPTASWNLLKQRDIFRWAIPEGDGGLGLTSVEQLIGNAELGAQCLTTAFILSQRDAGIRQLLKGPEALRQRYLPSLAEGTDLSTVGLSQLTTSRQHSQPSLRAKQTADGHYELEGEIPWVTAADHATLLVGGATLNDGKQFLFVIPTSRKGIVVHPPLTLTALAGSRTAAIGFDQVIVQADELLTTPIEKVLGNSGGGGLETSCLAVALSQAALDLVRPEASIRAEIKITLDVMDVELAQLRERLHHAALSPPDRDQILKLRGDCTQFVLRSTQAALLLVKGAGFVAPHPAQRLARQALFFLVWSCPVPLRKACGMRWCIQSSPHAPREVAGTGALHH